ncbi:MAG: thiamine diphosphokinase [Candidatus Thalassarchaeaceae archaeon]|jgi:thiamine pyrophosphokinase|nr:thiamine diphosphokinase [Candidatus Thalassarchaeaceae archaeon]
MEANRWLLCAAGGWPSEEVWRPLSKCCDVIMGVDGGTDIALSKHLDVVMAAGDFDSIIDEKVTRISLPDQEASDLLKCLEYAAQNGAKIADVIGIEGGEIDHLIAVFAALIESPSNIEVRLYLGTHVGLRCTDSLNLILNPKTKLSLFAFTSCANVSISGVEYPLESQPLAFSTQGLHNVALGGEINIQSDGPLVVLIQNNPTTL